MSCLSAAQLYKELSSDDEVGRTMGPFVGPDSVRTATQQFLINRTFCRA